jgi:hypothetical protein
VSCDSSSQFDVAFLHKKHRQAKQTLGVLLIYIRFLGEKHNSSVIDGTERTNSGDGGYEFGKRVLAMRRRPTAALLVNETMVVGLHRCLFESGLAPGRDLAIIGFQDEPSARFLSPKVTCFRSELRALGVRLGEALFAAMAEPGNRRSPIQEVWPMQLVTGESEGIVGTSHKQFTAVVRLTIAFGAFLVPAGDAAVDLSPPRVLSAPGQIVPPLIASGVIESWRHCGVPQRPRRSTCPRRLGPSRKGPRRAYPFG